VEGNLVENFSGDGMRGLGDRTVFQYNTVKNCYAVNQNHDDGFQSWSLGTDGQVGTGEVTGIVLRGNTIINYEDEDQPHRGTLQGIGCFDGTFVDWVVENNLVVTDHWHGITLSGARDSRIVNNTVIDLNDEEPGPPWVRIGAHKNGTPSQGCLVRNNLTTAINVDEGQDVAVDHNLIIDDPQALFVDAAAGDFHLLAGCAAVDTGSDELAPALDLEGVPRPQGDGVDVGAFEYHPGPVDSGIDAGSRPDAGGGADAAARPGERPDAGAAQSGSGGSRGVSGGGEVSGGADGAGIQDSSDNAAGQGAGNGDSGCGCRVRSGRRSPGTGWLALGLLAALVWRRRQGGRKGS
jgi:MYXO-CTERM domain-containing protein